MIHQYVLDAHTLIWWLEGNGRLGLKAQAAMRVVDALLFLPVIALAEACWIVGRGRTNVVSIAALLNHVDADQRIVVVPLDRGTLDISTILPSIGEMHDRLIVATTLQLIASGHPCILLTRDGNITQSNLVPTLW